MEKTKTVELKPRAIKLDMNASGFQRILAGPPSTIRMKSGMVSLAPGESVGVHNTDNKEELIIVLEGEGKMIFDGFESVKLTIGENAYCPPFTEHNIINTDTKTLKYVYIVSFSGD